MAEKKKETQPETDKVQNQEKVRLEIPFDETLVELEDYKPAPCPFPTTAV